MESTKKIDMEAVRSDVFSAACPSRKVLELIASKWVLLIFPALDGGPMRNSELLRRIEGISQKVLTQTLKELERNGLVTRCDLETSSPHVEYELSPLGKSLSTTLVALDRWTNQHYPELMQAREDFDAEDENITGRIVHKLR